MNYANLKLGYAFLPGATHIPWVYFHGAMTESWVRHNISTTLGLLDSHIQPDLVGVMEIDSPYLIRPTPEENWYSLPDGLFIADVYGREALAAIWRSPVPKRPRGLIVLAEDITSVGFVLSSYKVKKSIL